jgi:hypothetical protein
VISLVVTLTLAQPKTASTPVVPSADKEKYIRTADEVCSDSRTALRKKIGPEPAGKWRDSDWTWLSAWADGSDEMIAEWRAIPPPTDDRAEVSRIQSDLSTSLVHFRRFIALGREGAWDEAEEANGDSQRYLSRGNEASRAYGFTSCNLAD